ncbi:amidohydrolase family protein [Lignipirellula cremea]|uniref:Amidohydrolase n=1 Tax=Lignipirellula cremea TaxID=2528010 RepID=A0A518DNT2_9BACT|nr:amidohydrolase family protein [Lignipirellula cremea]QDU93502.1 Amidohydrolase [Lignipirellula cremea]
MSPSWNRRDFLSVAGTASFLGPALTLGPLSSPLAAAASEPSLIVDTHTHFYDPTRPGGVPWPGKTNKTLYRKVLPDDFRKVAQPHGVRGTIVVEASPWLEDNQWILDLAKDDPWLLGCVGNLAIADADFPQHLQRFARQPRFRGIRIKTSDLPGPDTPARSTDNLQRLADQNLSLDVNGGPPLLPGVLRLAKKIPTLRIVIDHLPFDPPVEPTARADFDKLLAETAAQPNVYAKVSHVLRKRGGEVSLDLADYRPQLDMLWRLFGADRVIYGSNWPVSDLLGSYAQVFGLMQSYVAERGAVDAEKYFWKNAKAAYRWPAS